MADDNASPKPSGWKYAIPVALLAALGIALTIGLVQMQRHYVRVGADRSVSDAVSASAERAGQSLGTLNGSLSAVAGWFAVDNLVS